MAKRKLEETAEAQRKRYRSEMYASSSAQRPRQASKHVPRPELKWSDTSVEVDAIPSNFTWHLVSENVQGAIAAGSAATQRNGKQILGKKLQYRFYIYPTSTGNGHLPRYVRIVLIMKKQANGVPIVVDDVFDAAHPGFRFRQLNNSPLYKILLDKQVKLEMGTSNMSADCMDCAFVEGYVTLDEVFSFSGAAGDRATCVGPNIECYTQGWCPNGTTLTYELDCSFRFRFVDY